MKPTLRLPALLISLLGYGAALPAQAQTPLLEIDYQNATVFHVLDDGRLLLPVGAVDGYVLTADDEGYATWQAATGTGGLSVVSSNATLTGTGTAASPLGVSVPLILTGTTGPGENGIVEVLHTNGIFSYLGGSLYGAYGLHNTGHFGYLAGSLYGAYGGHSSGHHGYLGGDDYGAFGSSINGQNYGYLGGDDYGAYGYNSGNFGYLGGSSFSALGLHDTGTYGILGYTTFGVWGFHITGQYGYLGHEDYGAYGRHSNGHWGTLGGSIYGVHGRNTNNNRGYLGHDSYGVWATGSPWAGYFAGNVHVTGTLSGGSAASKVDHPLDPANRYLAQSFVESAEMKTVYDGTVTLDGQGEAVIELPAYVEALNRDFRYQLTCIGGFAPVYVAEEIQGNRFRVAGGTPGMKVSWMVTGIRQDPWAEAHRLVVEGTKPPEEQGRYLHPRLYGQPETQRIGSVEEDPALVNHEAMQQHLDEERRQIELERQHITEERRRMQAEHERLRPASPPDNHR